ncbi:16S rRNA (cytosine(967)-C(5))-methyltransferase RsmB [bacterium]|nr:16S rRNA (cytosine(967)-C(5))-methyltransferase RsmB [bacterium]
MPLKSKTNPRRLAWDILNQKGEPKVWVEDLLTRRLLQSNLSQLDQKLCRELCFGVIKMQGYLDYALNRLLKDPEKTPDKVKMILRLGAYQLLCLDKIPAHAAVHETVAMAKTMLPAGQVKMVNAILREITRRGAPALPDRLKTPIIYLAVRHSFPGYIVSRWVGRFGFERAEAMLQQANTPPPLTARINMTVGTAAQAGERLQSQGLEVQSGDLPTAILLSKNQATPGSILEKNTDWIYFQDQASQMIGWLVNPPAQGTCLDMCAAPGGKATHLAELLNHQGRVLAYDVSEKKRQRIQENAQRLGLDNLSVIAELDDSIAVDRVLVDAPCSGLGTLRRHVETRRRLQEKDHQRLAKIQLTLLNRAAGFVKPGGHLIYATCTTEPEENEDVIKIFLAGHAGFSVLPGPGREGIPAATYWGKDGFFRTFPRTTGMDAMFAARLIRQT